MRVTYIAFLVMDVVTVEILYYATSIILSPVEGALLPFHLPLKNQGTSGIA